MRRVAWIVLISTVATAGCATSRYAGPTLTPEVDRTIRQEHPRAALDVIVPGPRGPRRGELVRVLPTEALVSVPEGQTSVPLGSIEDIEVTNHFRGALVGAGIGLLTVAAAVGTFLATTSCSSADGPDGCRGKGFALLAGGIVLGGLGAFVGMGVGSAHGPTTTYHFAAAPPPD